jgi:tetratricopeptide (TPR) repeat protein
MEEQGAASSADPGQRAELVTTRLNYSWSVGENAWKGDESLRQLRRAVEVAEDYVADFPDLPDSRATWVHARIALACALSDRQPDEAEKILRECLQWAEGNLPLMHIHRRLGILCSSKQRLSEGVKHLRLGLEMAEKWAAESPSETLRQREVSHSMRHLAEALAANQKLAEAAEYQGRAVLVIDKVASDFPAGPHFRMDLAWDLKLHAGLLKQLGQTEEAEKAYRRVVDLCEKVAADFPTIPEYRLATIDRRILLSRFLAQGGRLLEAQEVLGKATTGSEKLPDDFPDRLGYKHWLVRSHLELAHILKAGGKPLEAQTTVDQAVAIQQALEKDFADKPEFRRKLASAHLSVADLLREDGRAEEAERFYHLAEVHWRRLVAAAPNDIECLRGLGLSYHNLGLLLDAQPRKREAKELLRQAVASFSKGLKLNPKTWGAWNSRGEAFAQLEEWDKAAADLAKAVALAPHQPILHNRHALVRLAQGDAKHYRAGCAYMVSRFATFSDPNAPSLTVWTCAMAPDAVTDWQPLVQLAEKVAAARPRESDKLQDLGAILYRAGRYHEAAKWLEEADAAEAAFPEAQGQYTMPAWTWLFQAMTLHRLGRSDEAQQQLRKAVSYIDQPPESVKSLNAVWDRRLVLRRLRQEAEDLLKHGPGAKNQEPERKPD